MQTKINYAKEIGEVGSIVSEATKNFGGYKETKINNENDLVALIGRYKTDLTKLQEGEKRLTKVIEPVLIQREHSQLVKAFSEYVAATGEMITAIDTTPESFIKAIYKSAETKQSQASGEIAKICSVIAKKLFP
ncbi:hypothetical protein LZ480_07660 [Solibacillus sp. MA9]|uniref:Uncharacterized protein n=1 Tax=Solibacillus palustris TaxID=2908203 RepID=A0ABS9UBP5_9BACL|nr:hypothetical protein [Solibacillus sp. MA9]MCH7321768.1 hypothetical protein [Solibacillus sp. MA9]